MGTNGEAIRPGGRSGHVNRTSAKPITGSLTRTTDGRADPAGRAAPASKRAWRAGTELRLSPKELALLEFFLRHPGALLTRSQIIEAVWDFAYDGTSNVVDQYVNYLRRKIDTPFGRCDIETVRGMGYRLRHDEPEQ